MKNPIAIMSNDWHLNKNNINQVYNLIKEKCELAVKLGVKILIVGGDLFDSRVSHRQEVMVAMYDILNMISDFNLDAYIIPGNHDKTIYSESISFLRVFSHMRNIHIIENLHSFYLHHITDSESENINIHFLPFFIDEKIIETVKNVEVNKDDKNILISHFAVNGSVNNDGSKVESRINKKLLSKFDLILLGHYHNRQKVWNKPKVIHCQSIQQNNFGEDQDKGFTIVYDDLSIKLYKSNFQRFRVYQINLDKLTLDQITDLANDVIGEDRVRFEIIGNKEAVRSFNTSSFEQLGIDCKKKYNAIIKDVSFKSQNLNIWDKQKVKSRFEEFCVINKLDLGKGLKIIDGLWQK